MKYSLRKSFSYRRRKEPLDDDHTNPRIDTHGLSNSNSNLVKSNQSKSFLRRQRRYSSSPPARSSPDRTNCPTLCMSEHPDLDCVSSSNDQPQNLSTKKNKFNPSFRTRLSRLLKKRHAKQQQHVQIQNCSDEDADHQHLDDDHDEIDHKKLTLGQRFDTLRRSLHIGNRNSATKGKRHLLSNE
ncbi:unnamed protein product [Rotaria magnacalcarata]|uniref:Uncharacterized protein n=1 Tax=Rotaria magnacalcarata TaxID=392030 RepID=A0A8S2J1N5_9BILA|nr:unnamed protein product [Rotaria magnacalcarata]